MMQDGRLILGEVSDFDEYSHEFKDFKEIHTKELETTRQSSYEANMHQQVCNSAICQ
jgi:hypothetical protein